MKRSNTVTYCLDLRTRVRYDLDSDAFVGCLFIGFEKVLTRSVVFYCFRSYRVGSWRASYTRELYLCKWKHFVDITGAGSWWLDISCEVAQGTTLSSLLYVVCLFHLFDKGFRGNLYLYAEDTAFCSSISISDLKVKMQNDLNAMWMLCVWSLENGLPVNEVKLNYLVFDKKGRASNKAVNVQDLQPVRPQTSHLYWAWC